jgi:hypothetical protein
MRPIGQLLFIVQWRSLEILIKVTPPGTRYVPEIANAVDDQVLVVPEAVNGHVAVGLGAPELHRVHTIEDTRNADHIVALAKEGALAVPGQWPRWSASGRFFQLPLPSIFSAWHSRPVNIDQVGAVVRADGLDQEINRLCQACAFSVEPGIYLSWRFGVLIEDIVTVTADGGPRLNNTDHGLRVVE